jgi:hypothetical protein
VGTRRKSLQCYHEGGVYVHVWESQRGAWEAWPLKGK